MSTTTTVDYIVADWSRAVIAPHKDGFTVRGAYYLDHTKAREIAGLLYRKNPLFKIGFKNDEAKATDVLAGIVESHYCGLGCRDMFLAVDNETGKILGCAITINNNSRLYPGITFLRKQSKRMEALTDHWILYNVHDVTKEDPEESRIVNLAAANDPRAYNVISALLETITEYTFAEGFERIMTNLPVKDVSPLISRTLLDNGFGPIKLPTFAFGTTDVSMLQTTRKQRKKHYNIPSSDKNSATPPQSASSNSKNYDIPSSDGSATQQGHGSSHWAH